MAINPECWSWGFTTVQIVGSNVSGPLHAVTVGGDATVEGEKPQNEEAFGALGIVARPRAPSDTTDDSGKTHKQVGAEAIAVRMGDRRTPFTWRDLRLNKVFPAPKEGTIALVGYGGAFLSFDDTAAKESRVTLYVPYDNATKCHVITMDPAQKAIGIIHGQGNAIALGDDKSITMRADGSTSLLLKPGVFQVAATAISLNGNTACGGIVAFPLVNHTALTVALGAMTGALNALTPITPYEIGLQAALLALVTAFETCATSNLSGQ
jgi:hypothetical protein